MASALKNLSDFTTDHLPNVSGKIFAIVVSEWNTEVTHALYSGAYDTLLKYGVKEENILEEHLNGNNLMQTL